MGVLKLDGNWKINGKPIFSPALNTQYNWESISAETAGRSLDGIMHPDFIRSSLLKIGIKYQAMTNEELNYILELVQGKEYRLTYFDKSGRYLSMDCYTSNSSAQLNTAHMYNGLWRDCTFNCIEE